MCYSRNSVDAIVTTTLTRRFGEFTACSNYPKCKFVKQKTIGVPCPNCSEGEVVERRSKKGKTFYGCSRYPDCDFVAWGKPLLEYTRDDLNWRFGKMTRRAGIGHWHAHEGRHTAVSIMSSNGVALQEISDTVGHKSTHVTETVYRHVIVPGHPRRSDRHGHRVR